MLDAWYQSVVKEPERSIETYRAPLKYLFEKLPQVTTIEMIEALLPWNVKGALRERQKGSGRAQPAIA